MSCMPNVHVRDVPLEALETLRGAAKRNGRSLNAELVDALVQQAARETRGLTLVERLEEFRRRWSEAHPGGYPPGLEPEAVIRRLRDGG
jgi:antitoxin FitA-like protein